MGFFRRALHARLVSFRRISFLFEFSFGSEHLYVLRTCDRCTALCTKTKYECVHEEQIWKKEIICEKDVFIKFQFFFCSALIAQSEHPHCSNIDCFFILFPFLDRRPLSGVPRPQSERITTASPKATRNRHHARFSSDIFTISWSLSIHASSRRSLASREIAKHQSGPGPADLSGLGESRRN